MNPQTSAKKQVWEIYTEVWGTAKLSERLARFGKCLDRECVYTAPGAATRGWDELNAEMERFHSDVPGGHFALTYFLEHHEYCFAKWDLLGKDGATLGQGQSVGEFNAQGKLVKMTGFFES